MPTDLADQTTCARNEGFDQQKESHQDKDGEVNSHMQPNCLDKILTFNMRLQIHTGIVVFPLYQVDSEVSCLGLACSLI